MENVESLSEVQLNQALMLISYVHPFEGKPETLSTFLRRVDNILKFYPTQDPRQAFSLFLAIEVRIIGNARRCREIVAAENWPELKKALINRFKNYSCFRELLEDLRLTTLNGTIREFVQELEYKSSVIYNMLDLEDDSGWKVMTTQHSIQDVISRNMPTKLAMKFLRQEVITISDLRRGAQEYGIYETCIVKKYPF